MSQKIKTYISAFRTHITNISFYIAFVVLLWSIFIRMLSAGNYDALSLADNWTDEAGTVFSLSGFTNYDPTTSSFLPQCVYYTLNSVENDTALIFRARSCYVNIYVNGEPIRTDYRVNSPLFGVSPGSRWHLISLDACETPVTLCLEVTACYTNSQGLIDNIYLGNTQDLCRKVTGERILGFVISTFLYLCGLIIILLYFYMRNRYKTGKDLLYLGLATFFSAQWSSAESLLWQLFLGHSELIHLLSYTALAVIPLSYGMLACYRLKGKPQTFSIIFSTLSAVVLVATTSLHVFGILDFHYSLVVVRILLIFLVPLMVPLVLSYTDSSSPRSERFIIFPLLAILVVCIAVSLIKYILGSYGDYSSYVRIALLSFLLCLIVYQFNQIVTTFSKGMKADMLHDLALTDHMTGLYNRTAFNEHTPEFNHIIDSFSPLGVIQFDVNNLKRVNDTLGHEKGDQMIKAVADGLKYAFGEYSDICFSYRTGGDEFLTIINSLNADEIYHTCIKRLMAYCDEFNKQPDLGFTLVIAHGYVFTKGNTTLAEAIDEADVLMYENKRQLKARANPSL